MSERLAVPDWTRRKFLTTTAQVAGGFALADLLAACGQSAATPQSHVTLNVLLANHTPYYAYIKPGFESSNNATITLTREQFALLPAKLSTAFASGGYTWDVVYLWRAWVEQFRKYLTPLDTLSFTPDTSDMLPVSLKQIKATDGKFYGLPSNVYTYVLYANKTMLNAAGVAFPTTYEDFKAAAAKLTTGGKFGYVDGWAPGYLFPKYCVWLHLNGGSLYGNPGVGERVNFDSAQAMQATADMKALLAFMPHEVVTSPWGIYDVEAKKVFFSGNAAMLIDYQHIWYEGVDPSVSTIGAGNIQVGIVPGKSSGPKSGSQYVGECFAIPKTAKEPQRALELLKYFSNAQNQLGLLTKRTPLHQFDPAGEDGFPAYKTDYSNSSLSGTDKQIVDTTFQQQQYKGDRYETRPAYQKIADTIEAAVSSALTGQSSISAAHTSGQAALDGVVSDEKAGKFS
jgi:ABC-type glycerol-3-phosphate transport system substrate-binding protein